MENYSRTAPVAERLRFNFSPGKKVLLVVSEKYTFPYWLSAGIAISSTTSRRKIILLRTSWPLSEYSSGTRRENCCSLRLAASAAKDGVATLLSSRVASPPVSCPPGRCDTPQCHPPAGILPPPAPGSPR